jgi:hypothetical protein
MRVVLNQINTQTYDFCYSNHNMFQISGLYTTDVQMLTEFYKTTVLIWRWSCLRA